MRPQHIVQCNEIIHMQADNLTLDMARVACHPFPESVVTATLEPPPNHIGQRLGRIPVHCAISKCVSGTQPILPFTLLTAGQVTQHLIGQPLDIGLGEGMDARVDGKDRGSWHGSIGALHELENVVEVRGEQPPARNRNRNPEAAIRALRRKPEGDEP
jgi:hypothetical protein